ncbi:MAG: hypothetical protein SOR79_14345 [Blautia sp.]|uniref:hypothetical protein n=1 Tax=Blautia sp. TaxID=1955243 RepID=UPI002A74DE16|nr:hypothetical protein [Blautia sp.]MDY3018308.1 hypothetical protein [Blautia sp.]
MKRILFPTVIILLLFFFVCCPTEALSASKEGLNLWLNTLLPTLLPFIILTGILIRTNTAEKIFAPLEHLWNILFGITAPGAYALTLGLLCGYPMGAKITSDMYTHNRISKREAEYLLTFTNHASPVFIRTYLIHLCLKDSIRTGTVYGILLLSSFLTMLLFRFLVWKGVTATQKTDFENQKTEPSAIGSIGTLLDASIMNGFETLTRMGGHILLFSVVSAFIRHFLKTESAAGYLILGTLELTTGLHFLALSGLPFKIRYLCSMCMTAFGGICILAQTKSLLHQNLSVTPYIFAKCLNTAITALLSLIFIQVI